MITLKKAPEVTTGGYRALPQVNLLPPEIFQRRRFRRVQIGLGSTVGVSLGVVGLLLLGAAGAVATAQDQVDAATVQHQRLQTQVSALRDVTATYKQSADAQAMLVDALGSEVRYSKLLNGLSLALSDGGVWVKNAAFTQGGSSNAPTVGTPSVPSAATSVGTVTLTGVAFSHNDVAHLLDRLASVDGLTAPRLQTSAESLLGTRTVVTWTATAELSEAALSGRYTKAGG